ncbi:MAG: tetratricopeptide repeat protein [bacterium]|nr:tetratricopeptide repeat protein [bacterium]
MELSVCDPKQSNEHLEDADRHLTLQNSTAALAALERALACDPLNDEAPLLAATVQLREGDPARAAQLALDALNLRPFNPPALEVLAEACVDCLHPDLAEQILRRVRRVAPGSRHIVRALNEARSKRKSLQAGEVSEEDIREAASLLPRDSIRAVLDDHVPTLSVGVIVRDGRDAGLTDCIASVREIAQQIVIVDARSDGGQAIANDIDLTRHSAADASPGYPAYNEALRRSACDWVLILEADEVLGETSRELIAEALAETEMLAFPLEIHAEGGVSRNVVRLVRNAPGVAFAGRIEPQPLDSTSDLEDAWGLGIGEPAARIERSPARADICGAPLLQLLELDLERDADNRRARLDRSWVLTAAGDVARALEDARRVRKSIEGDALHDRPLELEEPVTLEGRCLLLLNRWEELEMLLIAYHAVHAPTANSLFLEGALLREREEDVSAAEALLQALELAGHPGRVPPFPEIEGAELPVLLGSIYLRQGDLDLAAEAFRHALERDPDHVEAQRGLIAAETGEALFGD